MLFSLGIFCGLVIMIKNFKFHQQQEALVTQFDFTSFLSWPFIVLGHYFIFTMDVLVEISLLL